MEAENPPLRPLCFFASCGSKKSNRKDAKEARGAQERKKILSQIALDTNERNRQNPPVAGNIGKIQRIGKKHWSFTPGCPIVPTVAVVLHR